MRLNDVIDRLGVCIHSIKNTGDLSEWMSPEGIELLNSTLRGFKKYKGLPDRPDAVLDDPLYADFQALDMQIESYEHLLIHLTSTLKIARDRQGALGSEGLPSDHL